MKTGAANVATMGDSGPYINRGGVRHTLFAAQRKLATEVNLGALIREL